MERRRAGYDALAKRERALSPGNEAVGRCGIASRRGHNLFDMRLKAEIADDIGPFARRSERDRARPLADGEAFDRTKRNSLTREPGCERIVKRCAKRLLLGLAGDADEQGGGGRYDAFRGHGWDGPCVTRRA